MVITRYKYIIILLWGLYQAALVWGSLSPMPAGSPVSVNDKILHFTAYAVLVLLTASVFSRFSKYYLAAFLYSFTFSFIIECIQPFTGRCFEVRDLLANFSGAFIMAVFLFYQKRRLRS